MGSKTFEFELSSARIIDNDNVGYHERKWKSYRNCGSLPGSYAVLWYLVFIRKVFELHANATTRRNGHAEDERGCSSLPRIRVFLLLFLPSFHHSRGYSLYCFAKETGAWRVELLWHTFPRIN